MIDANQYSAYLATIGLADSTIRQYRAMFHRWTDYAVAHGRDPWRPDALAVRAWATTIHGSRSLKAQARGALRHLCDALEVDDVSCAVPVPRQPRRSKVVLDRRQASSLLAVASGCGLKGLAVRVGLYTAARRSEIAGMRWDKVDFVRHEITFWRPKTSDWHTVPLHPALERDLADRATGERWLFPGRWGGHVCAATVAEWIVEVGGKANVGRVTPHVLRRTALTLVNDANPDIRAAQEFAGHTDPRVTAGYTMVSVDRLRVAVSSLPDPA